MLMLRGIITQSRAKRAFAEAVLHEKGARELSNHDVGDVLGCGEGTVRNRLDTDSAENQPLAYELSRGIREWGADFGNRFITPLTGYILVPARCDSEADPVRIAAEMGDCLARILTADADKIIRHAEAKLLLPIVEAVVGKLNAFAEKLRGIIARAET